MQWIAYRAKSLSLAHGAALADSAVARSIWEDDPAWQPARETLETLLLAYDWGEAFTALNLVIKPLFDALFKDAFAELALVNGDGLTAQLLRESGVDTARNQGWVSALARYAVDQRAENRSVLDNWLEEWQPGALLLIPPLGTFGHGPSEWATGWAAYHVPGSIGLPLPFGCPVRVILSDLAAWP